MINHKIHYTCTFENQTIKSQNKVLSQYGELSLFKSWQHAILKIST